MPIHLEELNVIQEVKGLNSALIAACIHVRWSKSCHE
jgi:hypothetical protein